MLVVSSRTAASFVASKRVLARGLVTFSTGRQQPHYYSSPSQVGSRRFRSATPHDDNNNDNSETTFSSPYEYPTRTEAPEIVTTLAKHLDWKATDTATATATTKPKPVKEYALLHGDPFDDQHSLTVEEQAAQRQALETLHNHTTTASTTSTSSSPHLLPITPKVPVFVPPNVPSDQLDVPETLITRLDNGVRVVSQETYGQMSTVGVLTNIGSRQEPVTGMIHLLETMAFGPTSKYTGMEITQALQDWGATRFVSHSREQTLHCLDMLRPHVSEGMDVLAQVVLEPRIETAVEEFLLALDTMAFQAQEQLPALVLGEALQEAAYGNDQQLGKPHFATPETLALLTPSDVADFFGRAIPNNPHQMVVAGAGISHDDLVKLAEARFGHLRQEEDTKVPPTIRSTYRGGGHFIPAPPPDASQSVYQMMAPTEQYCHVGLAFPVGGWHESHEMVTACVLQMLLGGGSSFSAGGPGKGMYSRLYRTVLNRFAFMESAEAFTSFAEEGGLVGISASTSHAKQVPNVVTILADQWMKLAREPVTQEELSRARNMLQCNVLTQLESRLVLFEDMGRQVLTYGAREDAPTTCAKIQAVTAEDIQKLVQKMLQGNPTLAATGFHLEQVPPHAEVQRWFQSYV